MSAEIDEQNNSMESETNFPCDSWTIINDKEDMIDSVFENSIDEDSVVEEQNQENESADQEICAESNSTIFDKVEIIIDDKHEESDSISVLSDVNDDEKTPLHPKESEDIEQSSNEIANLHPLVATDNYNPNHNIMHHILIISSIASLIIGIIMGQLMEYRSNRDDFLTSSELQERLSWLTGIEDKLNDINDVKELLKRFQHIIPSEMKEKQRQKNIHSYIHDMEKAKEKFNDEFVSIASRYSNKDDRKDGLERVMDVYIDLCMLINKINQTHSGNSCTIPKIISDILQFKSNLQEVTGNHKLPDTLTRMLDDFDKEISTATGIILFDFMAMVHRLRSEQTRMLSKMSFKITKQLCHYEIQNNNDESIIKILKENNTLLQSDICNKIAAYNIENSNKPKKDKFEPILKKRNYEYQYFPQNENSIGNDSANVKFNSKKKSFSDGKKGKGEKELNQKDWKKCKQKVKNNEKLYSNNMNKNIDDKQYRKVQKHESHNERIGVKNENQSDFIMKDDINSQASVKFIKRGYRDRSKKSKIDEDFENWQVERSYGREKLRNLRK